MNNFQKNKGFSLIELIVAIGLFAVVALAATSVSIAVVHGNAQARAATDALDNLSFALESMTRELRVGSSYDCSGAPTSGDTNDCNGGTHMGFTSSEGDFIEYRFTPDKLQRRINSTVWIDMTGPPVTIDNFTFDVYGAPPASSGDLEQPRVLIRVTGTTGVRFDSTFSLQTTVTQRFPDF